MWIATKDGLNRYDGYKFETYRKSAKSEISLSDNFIETIFKQCFNKDYYVDSNEKQFREF